MKRIFLLILVCLVSLELSAQEIKPNGYFITDTARIAEEILFSLSVSYPEHLDVLLPDSSFGFDPFEYVGRRAFPSKKQGDLIKDSVVYRLESYEMEEWQSLSLPVYVIKRRDSIPIYAASDSVFFQFITGSELAEPEFKENTDFFMLEGQLNYPLLLLISLSFLILLAAFIIIFGKSIQRAWKVRRLRKRYQSFSTELKALIHTHEKDPDPKVKHEILLKWKSFMETLENLPFTKFTTKEIGKLDFMDQELLKSLSQLDRAIYGGLDGDQALSFDVFEDFTKHRFLIKIESLKKAS